jgi:hypothetical protein
MLGTSTVDRWPIWRDEDQFAGKVAALPWQTFVQPFDQARARDQLRPDRRI